MKSCDALIVGGGPAGSTCARQLSRSGLDIMVMDKADFPRDKVCAGWITPSVVKTLELDLDTYRREHVLQPITGFKVGIIGNAQSEVRYQAPVSYGIRRLEFDDYLLRQSGARLQLGESVKSIQRQNGTWLINGTISQPKPLRRQREIIASNGFAPTRINYSPISACRNHPPRGSWPMRYGAHWDEFC